MKIAFIIKTRFIFDYRCQYSNSNLSSTANLRIFDKENQCYVRYRKIKCISRIVVIKKLIIVAKFFRGDNISSLRMDLLPRKWWRPYYTWEYYTYEFRTYSNNNVFDNNARTWE